MLVPFKLSEHIIHYFFQEFKGQSRKYVGREVKIIPIDKHSFVGKYIVSNLKKTNYPTKKIREFTLFIEMANVERRYYCTKQKLFKKENLENSFVELDDEFLSDVDDMLDDLFRQNFFYYVYGSVQNDEGKVIPTIRKFFDRYNLWNLGFDVEQMRQQYYRMLRESPASRLQNRDMSHMKRHNL